MGIGSPQLRTPLPPFHRLFFLAVLEFPRSLREMEGTRLGRSDRGVTGEAWFGG